MCTIVYHSNEFLVGLRLDRPKLPSTIKVCENDWIDASRYRYCVVFVIKAWFCRSYQFLIFMSLSIEFLDYISWLSRCRRRTERSTTAQYQECPMIVVHDLVITEAWYAGVLLNVLLDLVGS
jgi:hypothetical protein